MISDHRIVIAHLETAETKISNLMEEVWALRSKEELTARQVDACRWLEGGLNKVLTNLAEAKAKLGA